MEFIKSITQNEDPLTEAEIEEIISDISILDEDAMGRIEQRVKNREIALYKYLIGTSRFSQIKRFLDAIENGKGIPSDAAKAYAPAIEMLDEIVSAGPAFIIALKTLHSRAKKS